jgi:predicted enzyme related to lactoylglutathione lyase
VPGARPTLIEFPADDPERALAFWAGMLGRELVERSADQGAGWEASGEGVAVGVHERGSGPGDSFSLPYFEVDDMTAALTRVEGFGGTLIHPGERWSICRDSEGSPFALSSPPAPHARS